MSLEDWTSIASIINSGITAIAVIIGGIWVFFNFVQGRAYRPRLEPKISGTVMCESGLSYLSISYELKSVGLPKTLINHDKSGLRILSYKAFEDVSDFEQVKWIPESTHPVFDKHDWIERDETIIGTLLVVAPSCDYLAFCLELTIYAGKLEWNTETIVRLSKEA